MAPPARENANAFTSGGPFTGFADSDFKAYEPKKWSSNAFTLERRKAKDKLIGLVRAVHEQLSGELAQLELQGSDEAPTVANGRKVEAQWAFFTRDAEARAALRSFLQTTDLQAGANLFDIAIQHQHACLALRLDQSGLDIRVEIAGKAKVDRENVAEKLKQQWAREKLVELAKTLPAEAQLGFLPELKDAQAVLQADVESWGEMFTKGDASFVARIAIDKADPALKSDLVIGAVTRHFSVVLPLFRFLAWSRDNDHRAVKVKEAQKKVSEAQKQTVTFEPGDRVTILAGLFAGRSGLLAELDGKGRAKVMVGPISVGVEAKDLKSSS